MNSAAEEKREKRSAKGGTKLGRLMTSLWLIVLVALGVRVGFAWSQARRIPAAVRTTVPFQTETGHIAYSLVTGKGYASPFQRDSGPTAWLTPVYPLLVAGIFRIFGVYTQASYFAAILFNILCSTGTCVPIYYAGERVAGRGAGTLAAWMWAVFINAVMIPVEWIWDTSLAALLAATIVWATLELKESRQWRNWYGYGVLWGLALMTNPALGAVLPFLAGWLAYRAGEGRRWEWPKPMAAFGLALLCCVPWTARNYAVFHRFIPFRSNLWYEVYIGNNENYDERRRGLPAVITQDLETLRYLRMGETAFVEEERRKALRFMETHSQVELWLLRNRVVDFWMGTAEPVKAFVANESLLIRGILMGNFLSAVGAFLGVVVLVLRRSEFAFPLAVFPVVFPVLYYVTHTSLRYRHPLDPPALLLTAIAVVGVWRWIFRKEIGEARAEAIYD